MALILFLLFQIPIISSYIQNKSLILPFTKLPVGKYLEENNYNVLTDMISFHIYTNITIGTPPQIVAHFIEPSENYFQYRSKSISHITGNYNYDKLMQQKKNFYYNISNSSTFYSYYDIRLYSDFAYFNDNLKLNFSFIIFSNNKNDKYKSGSIGLSAPLEYDNIDERDSNYFIYELKKLNLTEDYVWSIVYENDKNLTNFNENEIIGNLKIGQYLHKIDNKKYKEDDLINIYSNGQYFSQGYWKIPINEIKYNLSDNNYIENDSLLEFNILSSYIIGSKNYENKIKEQFFDDVIKLSLCKSENIKDNLYRLNNMTIYSCDNNDSVFNNYIKNFPNLYFIKNDQGLIFTFTYKDLFKIINNRWYFMVIFYENKQDSTSNIIWTMGEIFLRKYHTTFNIDKKSVIFYKNQVNSENGMSGENNDNENNGSSFSFGWRICIEIILVLIIIGGIVFFVKYFKKSRKQHANELDDNYDYIPNENENKLFESEVKENNN